MDQIGSVLGILWVTLCFGIAALMFGLRFSKVYFRSKQHTFANFISLALICLMLLFLYMTIVIQLVQDFYEDACLGAFYICAVLYASSKVVSYLYMLEKVYLATSFGVPRRKDKMYRINFCLLLPFSLQFVLMLVFGDWERQIVDTGTLKGSHVLCKLKLPPPSSLPLAAYDTFYTFLLTTQFLKVLIKSRERNSSRMSDDSKDRLQRVALKNAQGSILAMFSTMTNMFILAHYGESGQSVQMCYSLCATDLVVNCFVVHRMASPGSLFGCLGTIENSNKVMPTVPSAIATQNYGNSNAMFSAQEGGHVQVIPTNTQC